MRKCNKKGFTLVEAIVSLAVLGLFTLVLSAMISDMRNNVTSIQTQRGLFSVMENILETYQIDVTRERDIATGETVLEAEYNGKTTLSEINVERATIQDLNAGYGQRVYVISIKTYYKDRPKHFVVDRVVMTKGVGINAI